MDDVRKTLATNLQKYRKRIGLTQEDLAEKLGVTFQAVSKWENAKTAPDIFLLPMIADLFCRSIDDLFSRGKMQPMRMDKIIVADNVFDASYFGAMDMSSWSDCFTKREFWRLENTKDSFQGCARTYDVLPYNNYPFIDIEKGQVFVIDYHRKNGEIERKYYIADGTLWQNMPSTRRIIIE